MAKGRIRVNGETVTEPGTKVDPDEDTVEVDGKVVSRPPPRWILLNKPRGYLTTRDDPHGRPTVYDLLPPACRKLRYVGRLDLDTEGLLLLTNEGDAVHRLLHPSWEVDREYRVTVEGHVDEEVLERMRTGIRLEDGEARAVEARRLDEAGHGSVLGLVLREGRKREVRRMCQAAGHPATHLRRVRFGPVSLGELPAGEWRDLTGEEVRALKGRVGLESSGG